MNLFGKMLMKMAGVATGQTYSLQDAALGKFFATTSHAGKNISEDAMLQVSAAWSCIRILSETLGSLPWHVYEDDGKGNSRKVEDHPVAAVLGRSPNLNMTSVEYREAKTLNLCQNGNAYSFRETLNNGDLTSLTPIESCNVQPVQRADGSVFYKVLDRGQWVEVPQEKIWHVKGFGRNGLVGLSPLGAAREALGTALATEEFGARFFSQGGMPSGIVSTDKFLNPDQRVIARENLNTMLGGLGNAHKFALMEGGMKVDAWASMPLEDMQFILTRKFSIQEICRFYRIPPHMVADLDRATFSNIEHMSQEFVMFTLMPYFTRFESSATKWLFKPGDRRKFFLRFNYEGLLRADSAGRAALHNSALQNGWKNRNEVRALENLPRSDAPGMDDYTVQLNMTPISKLEAMADANIEKAKQPAPAPFKETFSNESSEQHFNLVMPETMKQHLTQRVELPAIDRLANMVKDSAERQSLSSAAAIAHVMKVADRLDETLEELKSLRTMERHVIFDDDGEPIGVKNVEPQRAH